MNVIVIIGIVALVAMLLFWNRRRLWVQPSELLGALQLHALIYASPAIRMQKASRTYLYVIALRGFCQGAC